MGNKKFNAALHVELWKQTVDVQQHFNDIGWRIRAIALTALTFVFGATGLTYVNVAAVDFGWWRLSPAVFVPLLGLVLWWAFWFMDAKWFHRLLIGAVNEGAALEALLRDAGVQANLGASITEASPTSAWPFTKVRRSTERLNLFYRVIGVALVATSVAVLALGFFPAPESGEVSIVVNNYVAPVATPSPTAPALVTPTPTPTQ